MKRTVKAIVDSAYRRTLSSCISSHNSGGVRYSRVEFDENPLHVSLRWMRRLCRTSPLVGNKVRSVMIVVRRYLNGLVEYNYGAHPGFCPGTEPSVEGWRGWAPLCMRNV